MFLPHHLLSSAIFLSCPVIWGRRNGHRWFFPIIFCHPPSFLLVPSSGVAAIVIDGSSPSSSVICHLSCLSRHLGSSMVLPHHLLSSAIFLACPVIWGRRNGHRWFFPIIFCHLPSFLLVPSSGVIDGSSPSSSVIRHLSCLSRHLGSSQWSSMVLPHHLLSSAIFLACPVIWGRRNSHRWFFSIVFCHPPSFFLVPSSGVAAMVIDGSSPSSSVIRHLSFLSRHLVSPQWSSMVLCHRLLSSAIFLSVATIFMSLSTAPCPWFYTFSSGCMSIIFLQACSSCLLLTGRNHFNCLSVTLLDIYSTPHIHPSILLSFTSNLFFSLIVAHV